MSRFLDTRTIDVTASADASEIRGASVRGGSVTLLSQASTTVLQFVSIIVLARLLSPADYGVMAMVTAVTGFAGLFKDLGLSSSTIQHSALTYGQLNTLYWLTVAVGTVLTVIVVALSPLVGWFYGRPELTPVCVVLSLSFVVGSFGTNQWALLTRQMRFATIAYANISGALLGLIISVAMAWTGFAYWSLVIGGLSGSLLTTVMLNALSGWQPGLPKRGFGVGPLLRYGANVTLFDFINYFHRNLDNVLIGRMWGEDALGLYSRAYSLLLFPINSIRNPVNAVAFPAMSRLYGRPTLFRRYYQRVTGIIALLTMPLMAFLFVTSKQVVEIALGARWSEIVPIFSVLALVGFIQPVISMFGLVALSAGMARRYLYLGLFNTTCVSIGFLAGIAYGPVGVATGYAIATYVAAYPLLRWTFRDTGIEVRDFACAVARPAVVSVASSVVVGIVFTRVSTASPLQFVAAAAVCFTICFLLIFALLPGGRSELVRLLQLRGAFYPGRE